LYGGVKLFFDIFFLAYYKRIILTKEKEMDWNLIISLISGIIGGNVAGAAAPSKSLGGIGNTLAGLVGGGLGDFILKALGILATVATTTTTGPEGTATGFDLTSILANIGVSGVSGGVLTAIIGAIKEAVQKK
jgi:uncharacterized membrane protein YeaQ/YmgE (transglycosylase-associated protein family)